MKHRRHSRRSGKRRILSRKALAKLRRWKRKHQREREKALRRKVQNSRRNTAGIPADPRLTACSPAR